MALRKLVLSMDAISRRPDMRPGLRRDDGFNAITIQIMEKKIYCVGSAASQHRSVCYAASSRHQL